MKNVLNILSNSTVIFNERPFIHLGEWELAIMNEMADAEGGAVELFKSICGDQIGKKVHADFKRDLLIEHSLRN